MYLPFSVTSDGRGLLGRADSRYSLLGRPRFRAGELVVFSTDYIRNHQVAWHGHAGPSVLSVRGLIKQSNSLQSLTN